MAGPIAQIDPADGFVKSEISHQGVGVRDAKTGEWVELIRLFPPAKPDEPFVIEFNRVYRQVSIEGETEEWGVITIKPKDAPSTGRLHQRFDDDRSTWR